MGDTAGRHRRGTKNAPVFWAWGAFQRIVPTGEHRMQFRVEPVIHVCDGHCILAHPPGFVP